MARCSTCSGSGQQMYDADKFMNCSACGGLGYFEGGHDPLALPKQKKASRRTVHKEISKNKSLKSDRKKTNTSAHESTPTEKERSLQRIWAFLGGGLGIWYSWSSNPDIFYQDASAWVIFLIPGIIGSVVGYKLHKILSWVFVVGIVLLVIRSFAGS